MILTYGDISVLEQTEWYTVELRSEKTIESTLRRLVNAIPSIFADSPIEVFVPLAFRDISVFELDTSNYIFARSNNFAALLRMKQVTGIVGLMTEGDSNRPSNAIRIDDSFVQGMISRSEEAFRQRTDGLNVGSFVRILDGEMRDLCGVIETLSSEYACVVVQIKTKQVLVETPIRNLLRLDSVPPELQVFYYSPEVASLASSGEEDAVYPDLRHNQTEEEEATEDGLDVKTARKHGRQQTVTAMVKRQIYTGTVKPMEIASELVKALQAGTLRPPKNLMIVHGIIKTLLTKDHFGKTDPSIRNYRDVVRKHGDDFRFSVDDIAQIGPDLGIPYNTGEEAPKGQRRKRKSRKVEA